MMRIQTTRFGELDVDPTGLLEFSDGLLGFHELRKFIILDDPNDEIFSWLQSCENPQIAFPILEPEIFTTEYAPLIPKADLDSLGIINTKEARLFCVVTIPTDPTQMTANLKAPILLNFKKKIARQCVLQDNNMAIREPIFVKLQQRVVCDPAARFKPEPTSVGAIVLERNAEA